MKKYKLVFKNYENNELEIILLKGMDDYEECVELCFIDKFTTQFENEQECIKYLKNKNIITSEKGSLQIVRPKGLVNACTVMYKNVFKQFSKEICEKRIYGKSSVLSETYEQKEISSYIIKYFISNKKALSDLGKTYFNNKRIIELLEKYSILSIPKGWREPEEVQISISTKEEIKKLLKNYNIIRDLYIWIQQNEIYLKKQKFHGYESDSIIKNPYEEYEKKNNI